MTPETWPPCRPGLQHGRRFLTCLRRAPLRKTKPVIWTPAARTSHVVALEECGAARRDGAARVLLPGDQDEHVPLGPGKAGQGCREHAAHRVRRHVGRYPVAVAWVGRFGGRACGQANPQLTGLFPAMLADQVRGDPVQPGTGVPVSGCRTFACAGTRPGTSRRPGRRRWTGRPCGRYTAGSAEHAGRTARRKHPVPRRKPR
jgi:hypothetical protein